MIWLRMTEVDVNGFPIASSSTITTTAPEVKLTTKDVQIFRMFLNRRKMEGLRMFLQSSVSSSLPGFSNLQGLVIGTAFV